MQIGLYYNSVSLKNTILAFFWSILSLGKKPKLLRDGLEIELKKNYSTREWFFFSSARGALAFFLKSNCITSNGDEVILSAYTCLAVPTAVIAAGGIPVYVDIDSDSLAINEEEIWENVTKKTRAIIVQHTLGISAPILSIYKKAKSLGIFVIEDCALSIGTKISNSFVGTFGDAAIFSMELSKTLSCGWGGLLLINNSNLVNNSRNDYNSVPELNKYQSFKDLFQTIISTWCVHPKLLHFPGKYVFWVFSKLGFFRKSTPEGEFKGLISDNFIIKIGFAQTLLARLQWKRFKWVTDNCAANNLYFRKNLKKLGFKVHENKVNKEKMVSNRVSFLVQDRRKIINFFESRGIQLGLWFDGPLSPLPNDEIFNFNLKNYPKANLSARNVVNIPCHNRVSNVEREYIRDILEEYKKEQE